jgi:flagellar protein FliO/FliZ
MDTVITAIRVIVSLGVVLGLLWFLQRRITRGAKTKSAGSPVTIVTKQAISPKASVVVIDVEGMRLLLGVTEHAVSVLQSSEAPPKPVSAEVFADSLSTAASTAANSQPTAIRSTGLLTDFGLGGKTGQGAMAGSILSPSTWKQMASVFRQGR